MKTLVDIYSGKILLEKNLVTLYEAVQEFWVAEIDDELIGCGALHVLWADLGEVRTVAVHPKVRGQGVGHAIVDRLLDVARELHLERIFVLTFEVEFFSRHGFQEIEGTPSPPRSTKRCAARTTRVWRSSSTCPTSSPTSWATPECC